MSGRLPFGRYNALNYVFDFYLNNKEAKHRFDKISTLQWCLKITEAINYDGESKLLDQPFEYDIGKNKDRMKIYISFHHHSLMND